MSKKDIDLAFDLTHTDIGGGSMESKSVEPKTKIRLIPGEHNLYIDKNGTFYINSTINGKRFSNQLLATSRTAARFEKDQFILDKKKESRGIQVDSKVPSVNEAIDIWKQDKTGEDSEYYLKNKSTMLKRLLKSVGHIKIDKVSSVMLNDIAKDYHKATYIRAGTTHHHTARNTNQFIRIMKSLFNYFKKTKKMLITSPTDDVKELSEPELFRNTLSQENYDDFMREIDKYDLLYLSFVCRAMFSLGLRLNEAINMRWTAWDKDNSKYTPGKAKQTKGKEMTELKISSKLSLWFEKASQQKVKSIEYIIVNPDTMLPYSDTTIGDYLIKVSKTLGYKFVSHNFRASFITLASQEYDLPTVQRIARHKKVQTTMKYIQVAQKRMDEAIDKTFENFA